MSNNFDDLNKFDDLLDISKPPSKRFKVPRGRKAVEVVSTQSADFTKAVATSKNIRALGAQLMRSMPRGSELAGEIDEITGKVETASREVSDEFSILSRAARSLTKSAIDSNKRFLPRGLYKKLNNFATTTSVTEDSIEDTRDSDIQQQLNEVFKATEATVASMASGTVAQQEAARVASTIGRAQLQSLNAIVKQLDVSNRFKANTSLGVMRKSLELQYRQLLIAKDQLSVLQQLNQSITDNLSAVVKNTSLPDTLKYQGLEAGAHRLYGRMYDKGLNSLTSIFEKVILRNLKDSMSDNMGILSSIMEMGGDALSSGQDMEEIYGRRSVGAKLGGAVGQKAAGYVGDKLSRRYPGVFEHLDLKAGSALDLVRSGGRGAALVAQHSKNSMLRKMGRYIDPGSSELQLGNSMLTSGTRPAVFDVTFRQSVVEVIPAWLSSIDRGIANLYHGTTTEERIYDVTSRQITSVSKAKENIAEYAFGDRTTRMPGYAQSVGATMRAFENSGLSVAASRNQLEESIGKIVSNAIAIQLPLKPQYFQHLLYARSDDDIKDPSLKKLLHGVSNKIDTAQALYFLMVDSNGRENVAVTTAINSGIYKEIFGSNFQQRLIDMIDANGYRNLFRNEMSGDTLKQDWVTGQIRNVSRRNYGAGYAQGESEYVGALQQDARGRQDIMRLRNDALTLVGGRGAVTGEFQDSKYTKYQRPNSSAYRRIFKFYDKGGKVAMDAFLRELQRSPYHTTETLRQSFNVVQQMKIIELEKQLLEERRQGKSSTQTSSGANLVGPAHMTPDVNFFDDDPKASKAFLARYGQYSAEHRPYLMQVANQIILRKTLTNIHSFLRARFTTIPSWRRVQFKLLENISGAVLNLPGSIIKGISGFVSNSFKSLMSGTFAHLKSIFGLEKTTVNERRAKRGEALSLLKKRQEDTERMIRIMNSSEQVALNTEQTNFYLKIMGAQLNTIRNNQLANVFLNKYQLTTGQMVPLKYRSGGAGKNDATRTEINVEQFVRLQDEARRPGGYQHDKQFDNDPYYRARKNEIQELQGGAMWDKLIAGLRTGTGIATVGLMVGAFGKLLSGIFKEGGLGGFARATGIRSGILSPFDKNGRYVPLASQTSKFNKPTEDFLQDMGYGDYTFNKEYRAALNAGDFRLAKILAQQKQEERVRLGQYSYTPGKYGEDAAKRSSTIQKDFKNISNNTVTIAEEQKAILDDMLKHSGRDSAYFSIMNAMVVKNMLSTYNALPSSGPVTEQERLEMYRDRRDSLVNVYELRPAAITNYMALVYANKPVEAAEFLIVLRETRPDRKEYIKEISGGWLTRLGKKIFKGLFTDGAVNYLDYGLNQSQWMLAQKLYNDGFYLEAKWLVEDSHWALFATSDRYDEMRRVGSVKMSPFAKMLMATTGIAPVTSMVTLSGLVPAEYKLGALATALSKSKFLGGYQRFLESSSKIGLGNAIKSRLGLASKNNFLVKGISDMSKKISAIKSSASTTRFGRFLIGIRTRAQGFGAGATALIRKVGWINKIYSWASKIPGVKKSVRWIFSKIFSLSKLFAKWSPWIFIGSFVIGLIVGVKRWIKKEPHGFEEQANTFGGKVVDVISTVIDPYEIGLVTVGFVRSAGEFNDMFSAQAQAGKAKIDLDRSTREFNKQISAQLILLMKVQAGEATMDPAEYAQKVKSLSRINAQYGEELKQHELLEEFLEGAMAAIVEDVATAPDTTTEDINQMESRELEALVDKELGLSTSNDPLTRAQAKALKKERSAKTKAMRGLSKSISGLSLKDQEKVKQMLSTGNVAEATAFVNSTLAKEKQNLEVLKVLRNSKISDMDIVRWSNMVYEGKHEEVYRELRDKYGPFLTTDQLYQIHKAIDPSFAETVKVRWSLFKTSIHSKSETFQQFITNKKNTVSPYMQNQQTSFMNRVNSLRQQLPTAADPVVKAAVNTGDPALLSQYINRSNVSPVLDQYMLSTADTMKSMQIAIEQLTQAAANMSTASAVQSQASMQLVETEETIRFQKAVERLGLPSRSTWATE